MEKPNDYDSAEGITFQNKPEAGPYVFKIVNAETATAKESGNEMIVLSLDIAEGPFAGFYKKISEQYGKNKYIKHYRVTSNVPYFKGDITSIEKSNPGFAFDFDEKKLIGKVVGGNLREEEFIGNAGIASSLKIAFLFPVADVNKIKPMKPKLLPKKDETSDVPF
jgi:hypothetical protein